MSAMKGERSAERYVRLTEFDPEGETKVLAAAMYGHTDLGDEALHEIAQKLPEMSVTNCSRHTWATAQTAGTDRACL